MDDQPADASQVTLLIQAAENLPVLFALVSGADLSVRYANRACRRYARNEDAAGRPLADILPMIDTEAAAECLRTGLPVNRAAAPYAEATWWDVAIVPLAQARHAPGGRALAVTAHDVSGHVRAQQQASEPGRLALQRSEQRLRAILQQIPAAVFIVEAPDGRVALQSDRLDQVLGHPSYDLDAARGAWRGWAEHPDGRPYALTEYPSRRALLHGETVQAEPMTYRRGDGRRINLEMYAGPVRDESGAIVAAVAAALDVTERLQAEATLRESEARARLAIEAGGLGTWEVDLAANTIRYGPECAAMVGLPAEPLVLHRGDSPAFVHPDDEQRVRSEFEAAVASGAPYHSEFRGITAQGETRWFVCHGRLLHRPDGAPERAVGVIRDVTQRHLREESLRAAIQARELLVREADHRIKNSLQLVASLLGLQRARMTDPDAIAALDDAMVRVMAVGEAHRALHESEDLREISFDQMLRDLCRHVGTLNPQVRFECGAEKLALDTERAIPLGLIVSELLTNAAKHAYAGGSGAVRAAAVCTEDGWVEVTVADDGVGLPPGGPSRGGFGSTIIRALARKIAAEVTTASQPGRGARTTLRFKRTP